MSFSIYYLGSNSTVFWFSLTHVKSLMLYFWLYPIVFLSKKEKRKEKFHVEIFNHQMFYWNETFFLYPLIGSIYISLMTAWITVSEWHNSNFKCIFSLYKMNGWIHFVLILWNTCSKITEFSFSGILFYIPLFTLLIINTTKCNNDFIF